ncbi:ATP-binding protein [Halarcobacter sp.]|uniref:ATP-binding protein n=1 Tax=Halarcobacter sp. TaxID=2321133 RepID=UPI002AA8D693|nr:ATP-binding protein [Halarcobacter sp.]
MFEENIPSAKNLICALRDIGYSLETAVADIIDNSISAKATEINIYIKFDFQNSYIAIIDNGIGMNEEELKDAMKLGSLNPLQTRQKNDLGRFGLGLKTASFSQASKLTVASSQNLNTYARCWDLEHIIKTEKWEIENLNNKLQDIIKINKLLSCGTLVVWEKLDKLIEKNTKRKAEDIFQEKIAILRDHLSLVFHRYLTGEPGIKKIVIKLNNDNLIPFNPFEGAGKPFPEEEFNNIKMQAYLLPHHSKISYEQYKKLEGKDGYLNSQGFYIYRNSRLLVYGTWFRLIKKTDITKLARVKIDLPNSEDFSWSIDVKKSQAVPPDNIKNELKRTIDKITSQSTRVYTKRGAKISKKDNVSFWNEYHNHNKKSYKINLEHPMISELLSNLDLKDKNSVKEIFSYIEDNLPIDTIYSDMTIQPENIRQQNIEKEKLLKYAEDYWKIQKEMGNEDDIIKKKFLNTEPFSHFIEFSENFVNYKLES